ncbi:GNAT family N-acetyltransferase [Streptomyces canus]|uniref:GNAT family N-acetyltransferase n=1 Tax=Streptomyces canus TaxID=58343 RepID=UPI00387095BF|nr:GNAT family N-acetyltransferase [Streptomyces canus]
MIAPILPVVPAGRMADNAQPVLALPGGLKLRPWRTTDAGALVAASHDPAISRWNLLPTLTEDEARARIGRMRERWERETAAVWAVAREDGGEGAGVLTSTGIGPAVPRDEHAENPGPGDILGLAAWIDVDLDRGHAEIAYWALHDLGLHRLTLCHAVANEASCRVAEKAGFRLEGTMRHALLHADGRHDQHLHARVRGDDQNDRDN